jgi:hypothetical protein
MFRKAAVRQQFPTILGGMHNPAFFFLSLFVAYIPFSHAIYDPHVADVRVYLVYGAVAAILVAGWKLGYAQATRAYRILTRSVIAFAMFYIATSHTKVADSLLAGKPLADFELNYFWIPALLCGGIGFFRPVFGLVPLLYVLWQKHQWMYVFDVPVEWMDYFTLLETGSFLIIGYAIYALYRRMGLASLDRETAAATAATNRAERKFHPVDLLVLFATALHFGNYFYAGLIKAALGDSPVDWVLNNRTELLVLTAWDSSVLPVSFSDALSGFTYEAIAKIRVVTNFITIAIQLLAVVAIVRLRWAILVTLGYDVLHTIIFITTGIFFWKFIILNLAIVAALSAMGVAEIPRRLKMGLASTVILSPFVFHIMPSFAWLDTPAINQVRLIAIADDGNEYRVPSNYFLAASVNFAQNRWVWPGQGPFPTQTWGTTRNNRVAKEAQDCPNWDRTTERVFRTPSFGMPRERIERVVRRGHAQILSMVDENGHADYDLFPHHIFSMPWYFEDFKQLDKRRIVAFRYESQAVCIGYENGRLTKQRKHSATFDISL